MERDHSNHLHSVRLRDHNGHAWLGRATEEQVRQFEERAGRGLPTHVSVDSRGAITAVLNNGANHTLQQVLRRFELQVDAPSFEPFIPGDWRELLEQLTEADGPAQLLIFGPEATGKDTFTKIFIADLKARCGADQVVVLTIHAEENDRLVGHLETKAADFGNAVRAAKKAGKTVVCYFPEIESIFAQGDFTSSWELQYKADLRNVIDGTQDLGADYLIASSNNLSRLGAPLLSRFQLHRLPMSLELAEGILRVHWPAELSNGASSDHVVQTLARETIAEATLASRKKVPLRAPDLTAFNGRFLAHFARDVKRHIEVRRRKEPQFTADQTLIDEVLQKHLETMIAPAAEAAGTRAIAEFTVKQFDQHDLPVAIESKLDWCQHSKYLAS